MSIIDIWKAAQARARGEYGEELKIITKEDSNVKTIQDVHKVTSK